MIEIESFRTRSFGLAIPSRLDGVTRRDPLHKGPEPQEQSILDRAFHGPETTSETVDRASWLEQIPDPETGEAGTPPSSPVPPVPKRPPLRWSVVLVAAAVAVLAFLAGYLVRPTNPAPVPVVATSIIVPTSLPTDTQPVDIAPVDAPPEGAAPTGIRIDFATGQSTLDDDSVQRIQSFLAELSEDQTIVVVGQGDPTGSGPLNTALGQLRADTVGTLLEAIGTTSPSVVVGANSGLPNGSLPNSSLPNGSLPNGSVLILTFTAE